MTRLRTTGGILLGFGLALSGVTILSMLGAFPLPIEFFWFEIDTPTERRIWVAIWLAVAMIGIVLLRLTGSGSARSKGPS